MEDGGCSYTIHGPPRISGIHKSPNIKMIKVAKIGNTTKWGSRHSILRPEEVWNTISRNVAPETSLVRSIRASCRLPLIVWCQ